MAPSGFVLDISKYGAHEQEVEGRGGCVEKRRKRRWGANNEYESMTQALWEHWSSHSGGGGEWDITSICPTIADPQLIPTTKEVTMASQWTATIPLPTPDTTATATSPDSHNNTPQSSWELPFHMAEAKPGWPPVPDHPPNLWKGCFPGPSLPSQHNIDLCLWTKCLFAIISNGAVEYLMPLARNNCAPRKKEKALRARRGQPGQPCNHKCRWLTEWWSYAIGWLVEFPQWSLLFNNALVHAHGVCYIIKWGQQAVLLILHLCCKIYQLFGSSSTFFFFKIKRKKKKRKGVKKINNTTMDLVTIYNCDCK